MPIEFSADVRDGVTVVSTDWCFDTHAAGFIDDFARSLLNAAQHSKRIVLDITDAPPVGHNGLQAIARSEVLAHAELSLLAVAVPAERHPTVDLLKRFMPVFRTVDEAVQVFSHEDTVIKSGGQLHEINHQLIAQAEKGGRIVPNPDLIAPPPFTAVLATPATR